MALGGLAVLGPGRRCWGVGKVANDKMELQEAPWGEAQKEQGAAGAKGSRQEAGKDAFLETSVGGNEGSTEGSVGHSVSQAMHPASLLQGTGVWGGDAGSRGRGSCGRPRSRGRQRVGGARPLWAGAPGGDNGQRHLWALHTLTTPKPPGVSGFPELPVICLFTETRSYGCKRVSW